MTGAGHMAAMGALIAVVAPAVVLSTRRRLRWERVPAPPVLVLPVFVALHAAVTVAGHHWHHAGGVLAVHAVLFAGAVWFWLPVLVGGRPGALRSVYLFLAAPSLDLVAVYLVIAGDSAGGIAMIVSMLPMGLAAVGVTWQWITSEEHHAW